MDRAHRMGQTKPVRVITPSISHKFIIYLLLSTVSGRYDFDVKLFFSFLF